MKIKVDSKSAGMSAAQIHKKAEQIKKAAEGMKGDKRFKALKIAAGLRHKANHMPAGKKQKKVKAKARKSLTADPNQGLLPGFTDLISPKAEELARDLVFKALQARIEAAVNQEVSNITELFRKKKA